MNHFIGNGVRFHRWDARTTATLRLFNILRYLYCTGAPMWGFVMLWLRNMKYYFIEV